MIRDLDLLKSLVMVALAVLSALFPRQNNFVGGRRGLGEYRIYQMPGLGGIWSGLIRIEKFMRIIVPLIVGGLLTVGYYNFFYPSTHSEPQKPLEVRFNEGNQLFQQGKYDEAIKAFGEVIASNRDGPLASLSKEKIELAFDKLLELKKFSEASAAITGVIARNPDDPQLPEWRKMLHLADDKDKEAEALAAAKNSEAKKFLKKKDFRKAKERFDEAIVLHPTDKALADWKRDTRFADAMNRGEEAASKGDFSAAVNAYREAFNLYPDDPDAQKGLKDASYPDGMNRGELAASKKDFLAAANAYREAFKVKPNDPNALKGLRDSLIEQVGDLLGKGLVNQARQPFLEVKELQPKHLSVVSFQTRFEAIDKERLRLLEGLWETQIADDYYTHEMFKKDGKYWKGDLDRRQEERTTYDNYVKGTYKLRNDGHLEISFLRGEKEETNLFQFDVDQNELRLETASTRVVRKKVR